MGSGLSLGRLFGIRITIQWSLLLIFWLVAFNLAAGLLPIWHPDWSTALQWAVAVIATTLLFASILVLAFLPWLDTSPVRSARFRPIYRQFFWILVLDCFVLGYVGYNPPEGYFIPLGQAATAYYFFHFIVLMPLLGKLERPKPLPESISAPVTGAPRSARSAPHA